MNRSYGNGEAALSKRLAVASVLSAAALVVFLSFKTPDVPALPNTGVGGGNTVLPGSSAATPVGARSNYTGQLTGQTVQTPFGPVQVQVVFQSGKITDVVALQLPSDQQRSAMIAQYAAPQLRSEVLAAHNAQVDTISGATYTSYAYIQSLQSALDQLGA
jgi:uncharacterized protein with FMN-binding domain